MARHPLGRRRRAAAAALAVLGLLLAVLGQASASHLDVEADGNLVWSSAWADSPPDTCDVPNIAWTEGFASNSHVWLRSGSSSIQALYRLADTDSESNTAWQSVQHYNLVFVSAAGTATVPAGVGFGHWGLNAGIDVQAILVMTHLTSGHLDPRLPYAFTLELHRPDGTVAGCSQTFWWGWDGGNANTSVTKPEGWAPELGSAR